jgi:O-antigen/teichoic acid export membrane protein
LNSFKRLLTDTAIYGISSIVGRFLNWFLVPYHVGIFNPEKYGIVSNLYSYVAFAMILLTYGMETGYFRFASLKENRERIYSTSMFSLLFTSVIFLVAIFFSKDRIADALRYPGHSEFIWWLALTVSIDAVTAIPFARLRLDGRPIKFAFVKIINILLNIGFNVFFLSVCPYLIKHHPGSLLMKFYDPELGVGYIFLANLLSSIATLFLLYKELHLIRFIFDRDILKKMLDYSFPILVIGIAGMVNQNIDKILIPFLIPTDQNPMYQLGIYGANYKLAVLMNMFIQAFRYSFEPFFFNRNVTGSEENPRIYATVMKYFAVFGLLIFLVMVLYIDIIKLLIRPEYYVGLKVVPIVVMAYLFFGVFFSASIWYKLRDKTWSGATIAIIGAVTTLVLNIILIPRMGYMGSAVSLLICFFIMMIINYIWGQKVYPIPYDLKRIGTYFTLSLILYFLSFLAAGTPFLIRFSINTLLLLSFLLIFYVLEKKELKPLLIKEKRTKN